MAVAYRGSLATQYMMPKAGSNCCVIENTARSLCAVNILRLVLQFDTIWQDSGTGRIMPLVRARKGTGTVSGGLVLTDRVPCDTTVNAPDPGVIVRMDGGYSGVVPITVTGTPGTISGEFTARQVTGVEQWYSYDCTLASFIGTDYVKLRPGEYLTIVWDMPVTAATNVAWAQAAWEEDGLGTEYTISGNATLSASPVSGAKIVVVTDLDRDLPSPQVEVITTGAPGTWSKTLATGVKASVFTQYRNGETLYTDEGKPFIAKP